MRSTLLLLLAGCGASDPIPSGPTQVTLDEDTSATFRLSALFDQGKEEDLHVQLTRLPSHGEVTPTEGGAPLEVTYTPAPDFHGVDTLDYVVTDAGGRRSLVGRVALVVAPVNDPPTANPTSAETDSVTPVVIDATLNDTDPDGDALVVSSVTAPDHGTAMPIGGGRIRYVPEHPHPGVDSFDYTVSDGAGGTDTATVTVTVTVGVPVAVQAFTAAPRFPITGDPVTLTWSASEATACVIDQGVDTGGATAGVAQAVPLVQTTWTLTCEGPAGPVIATAEALPWPTDADGDGLSDLGEAMLGTDSANPDTDGDGIPDGLELRTDPADPDSDDDGIPDGIEDLNRNGRLDPGELDPADPDSDGDGVCDGPRRDGEGDGLDHGGDCADPEVWFVVEGGGGDGRSWATAFGRVQQALDASAPGDHVWVREGRYTPGLAATSVAIVPDGRHLFGGFVGSEASPLERPELLGISVLDGDFDGDGLDPAVPSTVDDNSPSVVRVVDGEATIDGFTIRGGKGIPDPNAPVIGTRPPIDGGIDLQRATVRLSRLRLTGNLADRGAAAGGTSSSVLLAGVTVDGNRGLGHALHFVASDVSISDARLVDNAIGALTVAAGSELSLIRAEVARNHGTSGALLVADSDARLFDVDLVANENASGGCCSGSALTVLAVGGSRELVLLDVAFVDNVGGYGAISLDGAANLTLSAHLTSVSFLDNVASSAVGAVRGGAVTYADADLVIRNTVFYGSTPSDLGRRRGDVASVSASLSELDLGTGNLLASAFPFLAAASGELFLDPEGQGIDAGDVSAVVDLEVGYPRFQTRIGRRSATLDRAGDDPPPDLGRHYGLLRPVIRALEADDDVVRWDVVSAATCTLTEVGVPEAIAVMSDPSVGALPHGRASGAVLRLDCGRPGEIHAARATTEVP